MLYPKWYMANVAKWALYYGGYTKIQHDILPGLFSTITCLQAFSFTLSALRFMIDIVFYIVVILAIIQGWRKGLILALFSMICGLIGLAAAVKLSAVLATHMKSDLHMTSRWLPVIAFVLVFVMVLLIIRWAGKLLEKLVQLVLLGWLNKLGGCH